MAFPQTPLVVLVEIALGADLTADPDTWSWTDVTSFIYTRDAIHISRGRPDQASLADTSRATLTADNRDGRWSTRNPNGAWYGQLRKGTPIRISAEGHVRYAGFLSELPPRWDLSGRDRYAPLTAQGRLYQLTQGASPAKSALKRTLSGRVGTAPVAYWSLEDGTNSTVGGSVLTDGLPLVSAGTAPYFAAVEDCLGSMPLPDFTSASEMVGDIGTVTTAGAFAFEFVCRFQPGGVTRDYTPVKVLFHGGTWVEGYITLSDFLDEVDVQLLDSTNAASNPIGAAVTAPAPADDLWHHYRVTAEQNGASVDFEVFMDGVSLATGSSVGTLGGLRGVVVNPTKQNAPADTYGLVSVGHVALWDTTTPGKTSAEAMAAYDGEEAAVRFLRLSEEEGIPATSGAA